MQAIRIIVVISIALSTIITACTGGAKGSEQSFEYVPLSQYTIDSNAIEPGTPVQIIGYSGGQVSSKNNTNYFQFIVLNKETADTVRVLAALINAPGDSDKGIYTSPTMFDANKGVFDATFEPADSTQNLMLNVTSAVTGEDSDGQALPQINGDSVYNQPANELVVVNKSLGIFEDKKYKTVVGVLKFSTKPW